MTAKIVIGVLMFPPLIAFSAQRFLLHGPSIDPLRFSRSRNVIFLVAMTLV